MRLDKYLKVSRIIKRRTVAKEDLFLQATAPTPEVVDFLCEVRFRRDGSRWE